MYFKQHPTFVYDFKYNVRTNEVKTSIVKDITRNVRFRKEILENVTAYDYYDVQDGETPEIIADKYYNDSYRYWLVTMVNNILDPQWGWPLSGKNFEDYISEKYTDVNPYNTVHHYEKVITQYESGTQTTTVNRIEIDEDTYNNLVESTHSYTFSSGTTAVSVTKNSVTLYQYEYDLNESKRNIKLLKKEFANQIEQNLIDLMK